MKKTGELELFKKIWEERPHVSEVSGKPLGNFKPMYFSHVLTKGAYPGFRLNKDNIVLKTEHEHQLWEFGTREQRDEYDKKNNAKFYQIEEKKQALKRAYYNRP